MSNDNSDHRTFGVEEEYLLLSGQDGEPADAAADLIRALPSHRDRADRELFASQLETATDVCHTAQEALDGLRSFRAAAAEAAAESQVVIAGTALPPVGGDRAGTTTPKRRYHQLQDDMRDASAYYYSSGMHVHVGVPSPDHGIEALARLAPWAPVLLAMTANSPIWRGEPTGFASWRYIMGGHWPVAGYPPEFADAAAYNKALDQLVDTGVILDRGVVTWVARLAEAYPTIELRIADVQLEAEDAVAFAVLARALVERCLADHDAGIPRPVITPGLLNGAIWYAARHGLRDSLIDPVTAQRVSAFDAVAAVVEYASGALRRFGDREVVDAWVSRMRERGTGASRQIARLQDGGVAGLLELYRETYTA